MMSLSYPYSRDPATGLTSAARPFIPPHAAGTIALFEQRGHTVAVRQTKGGSSRYKLDGERERTAAGLSSRFARLYE